jgi:hypothetical protein
MEAPDLTVVVVAYRSAAHLPACLESVAASADGLTRETIVVDNASGDGTPDLVRAHAPEARSSPRPGRHRACSASPTTRCCCTT